MDSYAFLVAALLIFHLCSWQTDYGSWHAYEKKKIGNNTLEKG